MENNPFVGRGRLGDALIRQGVLSQTHLEQALVLQKRWGSRLGDILLAKGWVGAQAFYTALARHYERPFVNLMTDAPDFDLIRREDATRYLELLLIPWRREGGQVLVAVADPDDEAVAFARLRFGDEVEFVITSKFDIMWMLQRNANDFFSERSVSRLAQRKPEQSAIEVFTTPQLVTIGVVAIGFLTTLTIWPVPTLVLINLLVALILLINFGFRAILIWVAGERRIDVKVTPEMVKALKDHELPTYTILVPMYKEPDTLPVLTAAIRRMDYPLSKLDIKLILEELRKAGKSQYL